MDEQPGEDLAAVVEVAGVDAVEVARGRLALVVLGSGAGGRGAMHVQAPERWAEPVSQVAAEVSLVLAADPSMLAWEARRE